jgi:hypothetical protein
MVDIRGACFGKTMKSPSEPGITTLEVSTSIRRLSGETSSKCRVSDTILFLY